MRENLWIAMVHVKPKPQSSALSKGAKGAYANAIGMAKNVHEFEKQAREALRDMGLELVEFEDAQTFDERVEAHEVSNELWKLAESVENSDQVYFDAFYNYFTDDEIQ